MQRIGLPLRVFAKKMSFRREDCSRLIVKNLPKKITTERLRQIFSSKGSVSDVKLANAPDGTFRRFAYIGFTNDSAALKAKQYFDSSYIDTSKISVQIALPVGDPNLPRAWSKYSKVPPLHGASDAEKAPSKDTVKKGFATPNSFVENPSDPHCSKFISSFAHKKNAIKTWSNDEVAMMEPIVQKDHSGKRKIIEAVESKKPGGAGILLPRTRIKFDDDSFDNTEPDLDGSALSPANVKSYSHIQNNDEIAESQEQTSAETILETGRLFIRNLSYSCTEDDLTALFSKFGLLTEVHIPKSKDAKLSKCFAYVSFMMPEHAVSAFSSLDNTSFQGRLMHIMPAAARKSDFSMKTGSKSSKTRSMADNPESEQNWNTLFIRTDTVAEAISERLGITKGELLDPTDPGLATRFAVAETQLVQDTKSYLERHGVVLDVFSATNSRRSDNVILVKNLPFSTDISEIRNQFGKHGHLGRVLLPPTKAMGVVEFLEASEAKAAFNSLAYSKFKGIPLYLEWAPVGSLAPPKESQADPLPAFIQNVDDEDKGGEAQETANTLYVKNLNFSTTPESFKSIFNGIDGIRSIRIATKRDAKKGMISLGFGFVEFKNPVSLNKAIDRLQNQVLDGHALHFSRSHHNQAGLQQTLRTKTTDIPKWVSSACTKLIVRNIPFEASEKEVRDLFKSFAQVKRVKLPKKFNRQHRGFGFVDFLSHYEAKNAFETLSNTHFYGRHLVLEWAKPDQLLEQIDELRSNAKIVAASESTAKTKVAFDDGSEPDDQ